MQIGINHELEGLSGDAFGELIESAQRAAGAGLNFWIPQSSDVEALSALAVIGREVPVRQVSAVVPTYPRHPMVMAMEALTTQAATGGRLLLCVGLSHPRVIETRYGLSYERPVRHMREYLEVLMPLLHEGRVDHRGSEFRVQATVPIAVPGASAPPVLVGAMGSQMLGVAGRLADGTALWMTGPRTVADHVVPTITRAAEKAGRPAPRVVVGLPVCVTSDVDRARHQAADALKVFGDLPAYRAVLDKEGVEGPAEVAIIGDEESVAAQIRHLGDIGGTEFKASIIGRPEEQARAFALLAELAKD